MISSFYRSILLLHPAKVVFLVVFMISIFAIGATKLEIDASSNSFVLEDDVDMQYAREMAEKFQTPNMLIVAFSPSRPLLSEETKSTISEMSLKFEALKQVDSITSILTVPLLESSNKPIKELISNIPTLSNSQLDLELVKKEFLSSPIYRGSLVSIDFKTTAIVLNLKPEQATTKEDRDRLREENRLFIKDIRAILEEHKDSGELFLGGVNMISDDLITFVKNDLYMFGSALLIILVIALWLVFREIRWVIIPIIICISSIVATAGLLGFFGWEVTVVSSNFILLQLIITLSIILHLVVRYKELVYTSPNYSQKELVLETVMSKLSPSFFAILTTVVGFASLLFSNILPIINLGLMMSSGITISLILSFIIFPAILVMLPISKKDTKDSRKFLPIKTLSIWVESYGNRVIIVAILVAIFSLSGATKLIVENSFINFFKPTTQIYQGMKIIDRELGGTTPLDIVVKFKERQIVADSLNDEFSDFEDEFIKKQDANQYWFTPARMQLILKIHNFLESKEEIGSVQSLATLLKLGESLNDGKELGSFELALLYNKLPPEFRQIILDPYLNIEKNQVRLAARVVDSNPKLRRNELIREIETELDNMIDPNIASFRQTNLMILYNNMLQSLFESQVTTLGFVLALLFVMFLVIFRSIKIALIAITTNALSISVIFGIMGWLHIPLDLMTITIAAISLGIGVDGTIHYIDRFYKELTKDDNFKKAMYRSHVSVGHAICYTSFVIMLGFSILILSNFIPTIYFGFLTMVAMFMALLGSLLLLPKLLIVFKPRL